MASIPLVSKRGRKGSACRAEEVEEEEWRRVGKQQTCDRLAHLI
jgi:hypothetical protein